jgi:hypothetical protein
MTKKQIVMLATFHEYQQPSKRGEKTPGNVKLEKALTYLSDKCSVQKVMEEWSEKQGPSVASENAQKLGLGYANVGTPDEGQFSTYVGTINFPWHTGRLPHDETAPLMCEHGPIDVQEAREERMTRNVLREMENYKSGLFIVGIAHTQSLGKKLEGQGFEVILCILV